MKKVMSLILVVSILLLFVFSAYSASALTARNGNAIMRIYPDVVPGEETVIERTIFTENVNDVPVKVKLEADEETLKFIEIVDEEFFLEPEESKRAKIIIRVDETGKYEGRINTIYSEKDSLTEGGVALSSKITVIARDESYYEEDSENENPDGITGNVISEGIKSPLGISLVVLVVLLVVLLYYNKKRGVVKGGKNK